MATTMFAATFEFINKDKRNAVNEIVETKAHKKSGKNDPIKQRMIKNFFNILWN
jgi:hypothetical protein